MQEVVKRMQERQKDAKLPDRVTLVIAEYGGNKYPVILPKSLFHIQMGDLVWFKPAYRLTTVCGEIKYVDDYCEPDGPVWTLAVIATGMEPIRAIRVAHATDLNWKEETE